MELEKINSFNQNDKSESKKDANLDNFSTSEKNQKEEKFIESNLNEAIFERKKNELFDSQNTDILTLDPNMKAEEIFQKFQLPENSEFKPFLNQLIFEWKSLKIENKSLLKINKELNNEVLNYKSLMYIKDQELQQIENLKNFKKKNVLEQKGLLNKTEANINNEDIKNQVPDTKPIQFNIPKYPQKIEAKRENELGNKRKEIKKYVQVNKQDNAISDKNLKKYFDDPIQKNVMPVPNKKNEVKKLPNVTFDEYLAMKMQQNEYNKLERHDYWKYQYHNNIPNIPKEEKIEKGLKKFEIERILDKNNFNASEISEKDICNICLSSYENNRDFRKLKCNHWYHYECISKWLETKPKCPICKSHL